MNIKNNKIEGIKYYNSPNKSYRFTPRFITIHYTAGPSLQSAVRTFTERDNKVSAHLVIDGDGDMVQLVPFNRAAWHAGKSKWVHGDKVYTGMNRYSFGIEMVNGGKLQRAHTGWRTWWGKPIPKDRVYLDHAGVGWEQYTTAGFIKAAEVCAFLMQEYNLLDIVGHADIAPERKIDPGPAWDMESFKERVNWSRAKLAYQKTRFLYKNWNW